MALFFCDLFFGMSLGCCFDCCFVSEYIHKCPAKRCLERCAGCGSPAIATYTSRTEPCRPWRQGGQWFGMAPGGCYSGPFVGLSSWSHWLISSAQLVPRPKLPIALLLSSGLVCTRETIILVNATALPPPRLPITHSGLLSVNLSVCP